VLSNDSVGKALDAVHPSRPFIDERLLQALRIQIAILNVRMRPHDRIELEFLFRTVEELLRELVREAEAVSSRG
jgi:hypothetical protein